MRDFAAILWIGRSWLTGEGSRPEIVTPLRKCGFIIQSIVTIDEKPDRIAQAIRRAWTDGAFVVVTVGGLDGSESPTSAGTALAWDRLTENHSKNRRWPVDAEPADTTELKAGFWMIADDRATLALSTGRAVQTLQTPTVQKRLMTLRRTV